MTRKISSAMVRYSSITVSPSYVSNGHWIVRRVDLPASQQADVALAAMLSHGYSLRELTDAQLETYMPAAGQEWTVTAWSYYLATAKYDLQVLTRDGRSAYVRSDYLTLLGVTIGDKMFGSEDGQKPFVCLSGIGCVMPHRDDCVVPLEKARKAA